MHIFASIYCVPTYLHMFHVFLCIHALVNNLGVVLFLVCSVPTASTVGIVNYGGWVGPWRRRPLSPPHTQADLGVGGHVRERALSPRDHVTKYVIAWPCHVTISRRRWGGTHCIIGHMIQASSVERCARSVYSCPMPGKESKYHRNTHLFYA